MTDVLRTRGLRRPMLARDVDEEHRSSTPLELFFDLCFVVAVAQASDRLHHAVLDGHAAHAVPSYAMVFFAIWWAWMNFTWFASAYDVDDVPYRLATFVQIVGVLVVAAGVPRAFDRHDFAVVTCGYLVMRVSLAGQWVRASRSDLPNRRTSLRYAAGISACMVGWLLLLVLPRPVATAGFAVMAAAELAVPVWAERGTRTAWHPSHIAERYGLFTLIVLGESVLAATVAIQVAVDEHETGSALVTTIAGAPLIVFAMWWMYFARSADEAVRENRVAFVWGYGHLVVFASAAAVGAGLAVAVDQAAGQGHVSGTAAAAAVTVPVAVFWLAVWWLHLRLLEPGRRKALVVLTTVALVLVATVLPEPVLVTGLVLACTTGVSTVLAARSPGVRPPAGRRGPEQPGR